MTTQLRFLGAAQGVTGSCCLLDTGESRLLIDCGLFQERESLTRNWDPFPVPASTISAIVLTHAHLDHCGRLPKLVREGFTGKVFCTPATADIAQIVLRDSAHVQMEDAAQKRKRHERKGRTDVRPAVPLYSAEDVETSIRLFEPVPLERPFQPCAKIRVSLHESGHVLGSAAVRAETPGSDAAGRVIVFSGDVGRWNAPILRDPNPPTEADYVVIESTYGDRTHPPMEAIPEELAQIVRATHQAGGNLVIPSFAIERTQDLLYRLGELMRAGRIPRLKVFVDSPMSVRVTEVFRRHPELFDAETLALLNQGAHPCDFPSLTLCRTVEESKALNRLQHPAILISGSGMCTGGRIKHHLAHNLPRPESTVLFVGYQAVGTLGRSLLDGNRVVRILGEETPVAARIRRIDGFSAHADREELLRWLSGFKRAPRQVFVNHGEPETARTFAATLQARYGWQTAVPAFGDSVQLD